MAADAVRANKDGDNDGDAGCRRRAILASGWDVARARDCFTFSFVSFSTVMAVDTACADEDNGDNNGDGSRCMAILSCLAQN